MWSIKENVSNIPFEILKPKTKVFLIILKQAKRNKVVFSFLLKRKEMNTKETYE